MADYRRAGAGEPAGARCEFDEGMAVTLEVSAFQYFPWLIAEAKQAIEKRELMPGRFIRVRKMKESEADQGDLLAVIARHADHRGVVRGDAGHQGHRRLQRPPERPSDHHRLLWRHRPAQRLPAEVAGRVSVLLHATMASSRCSTSIRAPCWWATCCTSWASTTSSRSRCSWATTTPTPSSGRCWRRGSSPGEDGTCPLIGFNFSNSVTNCDHRGLRRDPQGAGPGEGGALRAPHHGGLEERGAPALSAARRAGGDRRRGCPTSRPSTRAATRMWSRRGSTPRTSWTTSSHRPTWRRRD